MEKIKKFVAFGFKLKDISKCELNIGYLKDTIKRVK